MVGSAAQRTPCFVAVTYDPDPCMFLVSEHCQEGAICASYHMESLILEGLTNVCAQGEYPVYRGSAIRPYERPYPEPGEVLISATEPVLGRDLYLDAGNGFEEPRILTHRRLSLQHRGASPYQTAYCERNGEKWPCLTMTPVSRALAGQKYPAPIP